MPVGGPDTLRVTGKFPGMGTSPLGGIARPIRRAVLMRGVDGSPGPLAPARMAFGEPG